ncbi:hypothetical protein P4H39_17460 [Paenibacillus lautus]|uniref:hypothetical protein n=1 Tax=Paenibacillus lautus TaxID=1401 RepID=UPI002DB74832|nr:hypothetical protein [Paenibacillus lautus]MEC0204404.1 hypothetical protein [Paenibacillus lautus]
MGIKVRNFYFLIAGILAILFAFTHAWNGQTAVLPTLDVSAIALDTRIVFMYVWHIITAENLVFGIVFIFMSFQSERLKIRFAAWTIVSLLIIRLMVILGITALQDVSALTDTLIDSIAIVIYVTFIIMGIKRKPKGFGGQTPQSGQVE